MTIREQLEAREREYLSPFATLSAETKGREREEAPCEIRTAFQRDRDRIIHCKAFRRLKHKTQVFLAPEGDHFRTRLTHTLEVSQIARTIARALSLNEDLTEAIALGHDLGHTPFGHSGESELNRKMKQFGLRFSHSEQSVRVVEVLEREGRGLNLTWEVRDGIRNHGIPGKPATLEGQVVRLCDKIAYLNHDIDDAIAAGVLKPYDIPKYARDKMGVTVGERLDYMVQDVIRNSAGKSEICQSAEANDIMMDLRSFMFQFVYHSEIVKAEDAKVYDMLSRLFDYYYENWGSMPHEFVAQVVEKQTPIEVAVCDYIACMTDFYSIARFEELFVPKGWGWK